MTYIELLTILINPLLIFLIISFWGFKFEIKTYRFIFQTIGLGIIGGIFFIGIQYLAKTTTTVAPYFSLNTVFYALVVVGLSSELIKLLLIQSSFFYKKNDPFQGILYTLILSLSFSTIVLLSISTIELNSTQKLLFDLTYPIATIVFAVILGYFIGLSKIKKGRFNLIAIGLLIATLFNAMYSYCILTHDLILLIILGALSVLYSLILVFKGLNILNEKIN